MGEIIITPSGLLSLLSQIDELSQYPLSVDESDGQVVLVIGDSRYDLVPQDSIAVDEDTADDVEELNDDGYQSIGEDIIDQTEPVEGGLIKQIIKTLLVGGMARLTAKYLKGDKH